MGCSTSDMPLQAAQLVAAIEKQHDDLQNTDRVSLKNSKAGRVFINGKLGLDIIVGPRNAKECDDALYLRSVSPLLHLNSVLASQVVEEDTHEEKEDQEDKEGGRKKGQRWKEEGHMGIELVEAFEGR